MVGAEVPVEERLGGGEGVVLPSRMRVSCNDRRTGTAEDKGAISDLNHIEEVKISEHLVNESGASQG